MRASISLFEITKAMVPDPKTFFWMLASTAEDTTANPSNVCTPLIFLLI